MIEETIDQALQLLKGHAARRDRLAEASPELLRARGRILEAVYVDVKAAMPQFALRALPFQDSPRCTDRFTARGTRKWELTVAGSVYSRTRV